MTDSSYELEDLVVQPGTYFNPQTEVIVIVDDTTSIDQEVFTSSFEGAEWVRIAEEPAVDEQRRDELIDEFQNEHHEDRGAAVGEDVPPPLEEDISDGEDEPDIPEEDSL